MKLVLAVLIIIYDKGLFYCCANEHYGCKKKQPLTACDDINNSICSLGLCMKRPICLFVWKSSNIYHVVQCVMWDVEVKDLFVNHSTFQYGFEFSWWDDSLFLDQELVPLFSGLSYDKCSHISERDLKNTFKAHVYRIWIFLTLGLLIWVYT